MGALKIKILKKLLFLSFLFTWLRDESKNVIVIFFVNSTLYSRIKFQLKNPKEIVTMYRYVKIKRTNLLEIKVKKQRAKILIETP